MEDLIEEFVIEGIDSEEFCYKIVSLQDSVLNNNEENSKEFMLKALTEKFSPLELAAMIVTSEMIVDIVSRSDKKNLDLKSRPGAKIFAPLTSTINIHINLLDENSKEGIVKGLEKIHNKYK